MSEAVLSNENKLEDTLLDIIVCPIDKKPLTYTYADDKENPVLVNFRLNKYYEIKESIPVLLEEESKDIDDKNIEILKKNTIRLTGKN